MKKRLGSLALVAVIGAGAIAWAMYSPRAAEGADHIDSPAPTGSPEADIADVYAWMSADANDMHMIMTVNPFAGATTAFPTSVTYVFHTNSRAAFGDATFETNDVRCQFYDTDAIECWVIANDGSVAAYVEGDPTDPAGLTNTDGNIRVFAGVRNDPFYFELAGFLEAADFVRTNAGALTFDPAGCPALDDATVGQVLGRMTSEGGDNMTFPAVNDLDGANVLAISLTVDKDLLDTGGAVVGVWGSTHQAM